MNSFNRNVLVIDLLRKEADLKNFSDFGQYIGGIGLGVNLYSYYKEYDPVIFSIGPLNGYFPFASKTSVILNSEDGIEDIYLGGSLSTRIRFSGLDSIVLLGSSKAPIFLDINDGVVSFYGPEVDSKQLGLPGKRSSLSYEKGRFVLDEYFQAPDNFLEKKLYNKNFKGMVITGTKAFEVSNFEKYSELYKKVLEKSSELSISRSDKPSCANCPMGCDFSQTGELGGNILVHCMVGCSYAASVYLDVGTVFSCLNVLGHDYTHEDIENAPKLISELLETLK